MIVEQSISLLFTSVLLTEPKKILVLRKEAAHFLCNMALLIYGFDLELPESCTWPEP